MKIGLIRRQFSASGGAELYVQRLVTGLIQHGHEPHLFAQSWEGLAEGAVFHPVQVQGNRATRNLLFAKAVRDQISQAGLHCVLSLERTLRQDVYRAGDGLHRVWLERRREFSPWWKRPFIGLGAFHSNMLKLEAQTLDPANTGHIIVNSEMVRQEILEHHKFPKERIHLIRNGINTERIRTGNRTNSRKTFGIDPDEFVVAFIGSGWERKGLHFLINALQLLPHSMPIRLLVAGKGRRPTNAPPNSIFTGPIANIESAYAAADLFVTLPMYEPSANVVAEALVAGLPVVTSIQNGAAELLQSGVNGTIVDNPADAVSVSQAIHAWFQRRNETRPGAIDPKSLSIERNVDETLQLLESVAR